jgi:hypothetical protein
MTDVKIVESTSAGFTDRAVYSDDEMYRYEFHREWGTGAGRVVWVLLNPATGDTDRKRRPTLGRCIAWSKTWGYDGLSIVNLFAFRATKPKALLGAGDPVGPQNDATLLRITGGADRVVAAWGAHGRLLNRGRDVAALLPQAQCLGHTTRGQPRHPLYVPGTAGLVALSVGAAVVAAQRSP